MPDSTPTKRIILPCTWCDWMPWNCTCARYQREQEIRDRIEYARVKARARR